MGGDPVAARLTEDQRQGRAAEVYRLHCRGWTHRAIAKELDIDQKAVTRSLAQARTAIRKQRGEEYLADLAQELTDGTRDDLADSWRVSEESEQDLRRCIELLATPDAEGKLPKEGPEVRVVYRSLAMERANRSQLRKDVARFNGLDKVEVQIDLSPRLVSAFAVATLEYVEAMKARRAAAAQPPA